MPKTRLTRFALSLLAYLFIGAAIAVVVAGAIAIQVDVFKAQPRSASAFDGRGTWNVTTWERTGISSINSIRQTRWAWSVIQVVGPPNTFSHGDIQSAWAQGNQDSPGEWLELIYAKPVVPSHLLVHETYNPGAVVRATVFNTAGEEVEAWKGVDPSPRDQQMHVSRIPLNVSVATNRVRIYLDSQAVPGWNEIDAVALVDRDGNPQWAADARAYTAYSGGTLAAGTSAVDAIVPRWTGLDKPTSEFASGAAEYENRVASAYGWPWHALAGAVNQSAPTPANSAIILSGNVFTSPNGGGVIQGAAAGPLKQPFPTQIIWAGLATDAVAFAVILFALRWMLVRPYRFLIESARIRRGCCLVCGYDLRYDFVPGCPECGWRRDVT